MNWNKYFRLDLGFIGIAAAVFFILILVQIVYLGSVVSVIAGITVSYAVSAVLILVSRMFKPMFKKKMVAFDAGGVYFTGDYFTETLKPRPGFDRFLARLKKKYLVVMLTNQNKQVNEFISAKYNLFSKFDDVTSSGDLGIAKPEPKCYQALLKRYGFNANDSVFVDDKEPNVNNAKSIGMNGIQFQNLQQLEADLKALGFDF